MATPRHSSIAKPGLSKKRSSNLARSGLIFSSSISSTSDPLSGIARIAIFSRRFANGNNRIVAPILNKLWITAMPAGLAAVFKNEK